MKASGIEQIIEALNLVSKFDIYGFKQDVLIQMVFTCNLDMTILFLPVEKKNIKQNWSIQYFFKENELEPTVEIKGKISKIASHSLDSNNLGKAVAAAIVHHSSKTKIASRSHHVYDFPFPMQIRASFANPGYFVSIYSVPQKIDVVWTYRISKEFKVLKRLF